MAIMTATTSPPSNAPQSTPLWKIFEGQTDYAEAIEAMRLQVSAIRENAAPEAVWLLEHPPLYTAGSSAQDGDLTDPTRLPIHRSGRGGQWTYHGPGQRVAYVMLDLNHPHGHVTARDIRSYVRGLEEWLILTLASLGVTGERREGRVGIWVASPTGESKIAAIGVRVSKWVSWHGISLNVDPDLTHFGGIVPCGLPQYGVTSLRQLGKTTTLAEADQALKQAWGKVFARED
jgi:lipoyl(octanoyl) transferase